MSLQKSLPLFSYLPFDIIREILLYDTRFVLRNNKQLVFIDKIPKTDYRFTLYKTIPKIYRYSPNQWSVILGKNKRYVLIHYLKLSLIWEYSFVTFSRDPHTNMMSHPPDSIIYI